MDTLAQIFADNRRDLPTQLGSAALRRVDLEVRQNSIFSARMTNARAVQGVREAVNAILAGADNTAEARLKLKQLGKMLEYDPEAGGFPGEQFKSTEAETGSLRDLFSTDRLNLILNTQRALCAGYAYQQHGNTPAALFTFPCWELVRVFAVEVPRGERRGPKGAIIPVPDDDWPSRWADASGELVDGQRMVATKDDPIWQALSEGAGGHDDALDNGGAPPFAFNSGMGWRQVDRDESIALGLIDPDEQPEPAPTNFGPRKITIDGNQYDQDILKELSRSLKAGALVPHAKIEVTRN